MDMRLDEQVRAALESRRGDWPRIAAECEVSHSWLSKFVRRQIPNPGYLTLVRLRDKLVPADAPNTQPGALDEVQPV